ncbi:MAG TPA: OmpA family protein [Polyangiaceae bacterium]|nr:OmpA family protein [Polyangiaceae bacterium]
MAVQRSYGVLVAIGALALACGSDPKPPPAAPTPVVQAPPPPPPPAPPPPKQDDGSKGVVNVSDEIRTACGISDAEAKFSFDSAKVQRGDQPVLNKLVLCFTTGKLSGRTMRLVGHADPRGEAEYNMVLGGKRADNVKLYLTSQGLSDRQAETTSRGEMDASGTDERGWAEDRRVDVILAD